MVREGTPYKEVRKESITLRTTRIIVSYCWKYKSCVFFIAKQKKS